LKESINSTKQKTINTPNSNNIKINSSRQAVYVKNN